MEQNIITSAKKNIVYVLSAQGSIFILGVLKSLVLPKILGVEDFGYWQIYLFYLSYVGIFTLGFNDGIYLKYGKNRYEDLPFEKISISIRIFMLMLIVFTIIMSCFSLNEPDLNKRFALINAFFNIFLMGIYGTFVYIFQITNRMKEYSVFSVMDKIIFIFLLIIAIMSDLTYKQVIILDLISKIVTIAIILYICKTVWMTPCKDIKIGIDEFSDNINIGIKLMLANLTGMLVTGIGRIFVENIGTIEEYSYYSFGISVTNLLIVFVTAISLVIYPTLKRLPEQNYNIYFERINKFIKFSNLSLLFSYFVAYILIKKILTDYYPVLIYLNILFVIVILQNKMQLLNNTFYKTLRQEKSMFKANLSSIIIFIFISLVLIQIRKSIWIIAFSTFLTMLWRCYASEVFLRKKLNISNYKCIVLEILMIILFVLYTTLFPIKVAIIVYLLSYMIYAFCNKDEIDIIRDFISV